jgi:hypothetical protein
MSKETFHGWTNYATWRVNLELLNDIDFDDQVTAESLRHLRPDEKQRILDERKGGKRCVRVDSFPHKGVRLGEHRRA